MAGDPGAERVRLELKKLTFEIENLRAEGHRKRSEILKLEGETAKLQQELGSTRLSRLFRGAAPHVAPITALVLAFVSIVTVYVNWSADVKKRDLEEFHRIVNEFASPSATIRGGAAVLLGGMACCDPQATRRLHARTLLLSDLGGERDWSVRQAIEETLVPLGLDVIGPASRRRQELERELRTAFGRGSRPSCESYTVDETARLHSLQEGLVALARVAARIEKRTLELVKAPFRCALFIGLDLAGAKMTEAVLYQADFSRSVLRDADLTDAQLDDVGLGEADIAGVKFCGERISGLTPKIVRAAIGWEKAYYARSFADTLQKASGVAVRLCL